MNEISNVLPNAAGSISASGIFMFNTHGKCNYCNKAALDLIHPASGGLIGLDWTGFSALFAHNSSFDFWVTTPANNKPPYHGLLQIKQEAVWMKVDIEPLNDANVFAGYCGVLTDVTAHTLHETALRKEIHTLQSVLESTANPIFAFDQHLNYTAFNNAHKAAVKNAGGTDIQIGDNYIKLAEKINSIDAQKITSLFRRALQGEIVEVIEEIGEPGFYRGCFRMLCDPIYDKDGRVTGVAVFCDDISEKMQLQKELEEKSQLLNGLLQQLPITIYKINKEGTVTFADGAALGLIGFQDGYLVGKKATDIRPEIAPYLEQARAGIMAQYTSSSYVEKWGVWMQNILFPDQLEPGSVMGLAIDITKIKAAEKENEEKSHLLNGLLQNLPITIYEVAPDGIVTRSIGAGLKALGLEDNDIVGGNAFELYPTAANDLRRAFAGETGLFITTIELGDKQLIYQNYIFPHPYHAGGIIGFALDITQQKEAEAALLKAKLIAEEAALAKQQFLSNMSHEIRTPMNAVIGMTYLLMQEDPKPEQEENLKTLKFSGDNLLSLINDILDYSKIESGKIVFEEIDFHLADLVNSIKHTHRMAAEEKGLQLKITIDPQLPSNVVGDPVRLTQILNNLISNALKFTHNGAVTVDIRQNTLDNNQILVDFCVKDTGIGIDPTQMDVIFESFTQASADTTRRFGGTGLGLAITKKLLQLQGSDICVDSKPGKGSEFSFSLHFKRGNKLPPQHFKSTSLDYKSLSGYRVLLVEDNGINVMVASKFMGKWDLEVDCALTGTEAVQKVQQQAYDIILMDLQMPEMSGYDASRAIRLLPEERFRKVPIIALTASALAEIKEKVLSAGMNDYISKPFNPAELYTKISQHLVSRG